MSYTDTVRLKSDQLNQHQPQRETEMRPIEGVMNYWGCGLKQRARTPNQKTYKGLIVNALKSLVVTLCIFQLPNAAYAQQYPTQTVRIIVPAGAGGPTDILARIISVRLTRMWGQSVIVENRAGGAQMIGADAVAKAAPDGYTLLMASDSSITINPGLYTKMPYDPQKDFQPVTKLVALPFVLAVHPSLPAKSVAELIALAKAQPGKLNFGSGGATSRMAAELFKSMAGLDMVHIPYKGSGPMVIGLLGNEIQLAFDGVSSSIAHVRSGQLRALAISGSQRLPALPNVPTVAEAGVPGYESGAWLGLMAPARTSPDIVRKLHADFSKVLNEPEVLVRLAELGMTNVLNTADVFAGQIAVDINKWRGVIRQAGITPEN